MRTTAASGLLRSALALLVGACGPVEPPPADGPAPGDARADATAPPADGPARPDATTPPLDAPPIDTPVAPPDAPAPPDARADTTAPPPSCDRATATRTAPLALLTDLLTELPRLASGDARRARVDRFVTDVRAAGGTPLEGAGGELAFIARGEGAWSVGLSTRGWMPAAAPMERVLDTDLFVRRETIAPGTYAQFKLVRDGSEWREDLLAANVAWDGIDHMMNGLGEFNGVVHPAAGDANAGRLVAMRQVPSAADRDPRDVFVYVPAAYDRAPACPALPLLFVHDGVDSLTRSPFQTASDTAFASGTRPALMAFVDLPSPAVRTSMYTFNTATSRADAYGRFLLDELEPMLTARFRVRPGRDCRGLVGDSFGGIISAYLAWTRSDRVALVGAQSASFWWDSNWLINQFMNNARRDLRVYVDSGDTGTGQDNLGPTTQFAAALMSRGYDVTQVRQMGGVHDWPDWQRRWPGLLTWLLRPGRCD